MRFLRTVFLLVFSVYLVSCGTSKKAQPPYYLEKARDTTARNDIQVVELKIQKNDLLSIQVYSASTRPEVDQLYNLPATVSPGEAGGGFLVDAKKVRFSRPGRS